MRWECDREPLASRPEVVAVVGLRVASLPALGWAPGPIRVLVAVLLAAVVPGYALLRPIALGDAVVVAVAAVALSLSTTAAHVAGARLPRHLVVAGVRRCARRRHCCRSAGPCDGS